MRSTDFPPGRTAILTIAPEARILSLSVLKVSTPDAGLNASIRGTNEVALEFDYLNHSDGLTIEMLVDAPNLAVLPLSLSIPMAGVGRVWTASYQPRPTKFDVVFYSLMTTLFFWLAAYKEYEAFSDQNATWLRVLGYALFFVPGIGAFSLNVWPHYRQKVPMWARQQFEPEPIRGAR